jgi:CubicO group peptidase (beta-lactamase class C family)
MLPYVAVQRLAFTPGTKEVYDNFGYGVLSRIATKLSGKNCIEYLRDQLCRPFGVQELKWVRDGGPRRKGEPKQLWNGLILEDLKEYRGGVSMPALCTFMRYFWIDGTPRTDHKGETETKDGSWDNSSTLMIWRPDGINVAWSFNGRTGVDDGPGEALWKNALDSLITDKNVPAK